MRTDPTDNGGLFIGRRPGTAPVRYRVAPQPTLGLRRVFDQAPRSSGAAGDVAAFVTGARG